MTTDFRQSLLRDMVRIRRVEETLADLYPSQQMWTATHFSIGQEAVAVGDLRGMVAGKVDPPLGSGVTDVQATFAGAC